MDLSPAVGHVRECPHSGTCYCVRLFCGCLGFVLWLSCGFDNIKNVLSYFDQFEETIISGRLEI